MPSGRWPNSKPKSSSNERAGRRKTASLAGQSGARWRSLPKSCQKTMVRRQIVARGIAPGLYGRRRKPSEIKNALE
jgi:hypothetical protein